LSRTSPRKNGSKSFSIARFGIGSLAFETHMRRARGQIGRSS
jgi:hypothetical protein